MRALILLLFLVIAAYIIWVAIPKKSRRIAIRKAKPHAIRVGLLVFIVIMLAYAAYLLPTLRLT